jgi:hypothetical protein
MKNGLYSVHSQMGDGVRGRASGVIVLRDGVILGGDPYFWSTGSYSFKEGTCNEGTWKGDLVTHQHTPLSRQHGAPGVRRPGGHDGLFRNLPG